MTTPPPAPRPPRPARWPRCTHTLHRHLLSGASCLVAAMALASCGGAPAGPALGLSAPDIKTLELAWQDDALATGYRLLVETAAAPQPTEVARLAAHTTRHRLPVFLPDLIGARYTLQACQAAGCRDVASSAVTAGLLDAAVGRFAATAAGSGMGRSVGLSADGGTLAIGAPLDDGVATDSGAVHLFKRGPAGWVRQAVLKADAPAAGDRFGEALALSADGRRLVVGAVGHAAGRGAVYVLDDTGGPWVQQWMQTDPFPWTVLDAPRAFGRTVALSGDGRTLVAGRLDGDNAAAVFGLDQGSWTGQMVVPGTGVPEATSAALSGDGDTLVIGHPEAVTPAGGTGLVAVYRRVLGSWQAHSTLTPPDAGDGDGFGASVALAHDGLTLAVGAPREDGGARVIDGPRDDGRTDSGAVHVFSLDSGAWTGQVYLKASQGEAGDGFGHALSLSADGRVLAATAIARDGSAGAVYVFRRETGGWREQALVKAPHPVEPHRFGEAIGLAGDGRSLVIGSGAPAGDAAYLY